MDIGDNRKDMMLTKSAIMSASQHERIPYGEVAREMRKRAGLTQEEVADRSGVTARTIRNIERGAVAGQAEKLISIFIALGVDLDGTIYSVDVQRHLRVLGEMISRIDVDHRDEAVTAVVLVLADELQKHPAPMGKVTHAKFGREEPADTQLAEVAAEGFTYNPDETAADYDNA